MIKRFSVYKIKLLKPHKEQLEIRNVIDIKYNEEDINLKVFDIKTGDREDIKIKKNKIQYKIITGNLFFKADDNFKYISVKDEKNFPKIEDEFEEWQSVNVNSKSRRW